MCVGVTQAGQPAGHPHSARHRRAAPQAHSQSHHPYFDFRVQGHVRTLLQRRGPGVQRETLNTVIGFSLTREDPTGDRHRILRTCV